MFGGGLLSMGKAKAEHVAKLTAERADQATKLAEEKARQAQTVAKDTSPKVLASVQAAGETARSKGVDAATGARRKMAGAVGSTIGVRHARSPSPQPEVAVDYSQYYSSSAMGMTQQSSAAVAPTSEPEVLRLERPASTPTTLPLAGGVLAGINGGQGGLLSKGRAKAKQAAAVTAEKAEQAAKLAEEKTQQARAEARRKVEQQRETDPGREQLVASC